MEHTVALAVADGELSEEDDEEEDAMDAAADAQKMLKAMLRLHQNRADLAERLEEWRKLRKKESQRLAKASAPKLALIPPVEGGEFMTMSRYIHE